MLIAKQNPTIHREYRRMHFRSDSERAVEAAARVPRYAHTSPMTGPISTPKPSLARMPFPTVPAVVSAAAVATAAAVAVVPEATGNATNTPKVNAAPGPVRVRVDS